MLQPQFASIDALTLLSDSDVCGRLRRLVLKLFVLRFVAIAATGRATSTERKENRRPLPYVPMPNTIDFIIFVGIAGIAGMAVVG